MPRVQSRIHELPARVKMALGEAVKRAAESHVSISKQLAPVSDIVEEGYVHMKDQIHAEKITDITYRVISPASYSVFVEFGTENMDAQPFFIPAYESARRQLNNELLSVFRGR